MDRKARDKPSFWGAVLAFLASWGADLLLAAGAGMVAAGCGMIYVPAGWIAGGVLAICGGVLMARGAGGDGG